METKEIVGPIKIVGSKDKKASDILKNSFYDALAKIKLNMPFKADGFRPEKIPNQPDGTPIEVEPADLHEGKMEIIKEEPEIKDKKERKSSDDKRKALPPGKRISKKGKRYYEHRKNRSD